MQFEVGLGRIWVRKKEPVDRLLVLIYVLVEVSGVAPLSASEITPASPSAATNFVLVHPSTLWPAKGQTSPVNFPLQPQALLKE